MTSQPIQWSDKSISNFDHLIDDGLEQDLRDGMYARYFGWNFCGDLYFKDDRFYCDVYVYHVMQETISVNKLKDIIAAVSDKYGWN